MRRLNVMMRKRRGAQPLSVSVPTLRRSVCTLCAAIIGLMGAIVCQSASAAVTLVENGRAQAVVVVADTPSPVAAYAAEEFVLHVALATGVKLPIVREPDVPGGVVNIVTGPRSELTRVLAQHDDVAALWVFADPGDCALAEREAAGNLKPVWAEPRARDWAGPEGQPHGFRQRALQVKTVWVPFGA